MRAARESSVPLPFNPSRDIWSGEKLVNWAERHHSAVVNFSAQNSGGAVVKAGDIYVASNHHIGMAMLDSNNGTTFLSVDGNQSTADSGRSAITRNNLRIIANCLVIVRI